MTEGALQEAQAEDILEFKEYDEALKYYVKAYNKGQNLRHENNHVEALACFRRAQNAIKAARQQGFDEFELVYKESTLHFAVTECLTILQESPGAIMEEYHAFGTKLQTIILELAQRNGAFRAIQEAFYEGFTFTDLRAVEIFLSELEDLQEGIVISELSTSDRSLLAMFYFYLTEYFEAIHDFFVFSTKHVDKGKVCSRMFKHASSKALDYFNEIDAGEAQEERIAQYKDHAETWFDIHVHVMEAKMAFYMQHNVGETFIAIGSHYEDKFWEIIEENLQEAPTGNIPLRKVLQSMEILIDVYATEALMNMQQYDRARTGINEIIQLCGDLHRRGVELPRKVLFKANLYLAKIAQKYLLDCRYNPEDVLKQLQIAMPIQTGRLSEHEPPTSYDFLEQAGTLIANSDMPEEAQKEATIKELATKMEIALDSAYAQAEKYAPDKAGRHRELNELTILRARKLLYEYILSPEKISDPESLQQVIGAQADEVLKDFEKYPEGLKVPLIKLNNIEQIVLDAIPLVNIQALNYYRHLAEAYVVRARISIERVKAFGDYTYKNSILLGEECEALEDAHQNIRIAFNILKELDDADDTLRMELHSMYSELEILKYRPGGEIGPQSGTSEMEAVAQSFAVRLWNKKLLEVLMKNAQINGGASQAVLDEEFTNAIQELIPYIRQIIAVRFDPEYEKYFHEGISEQNRYGHGENMRTIIRMSKSSVYAADVKSDLQLTEKEKSMLKHVLLFYERIAQVYEARRRIAMSDGVKYKNFIFNQADAVSKSMVGEKVIKESGEVAALAGKLLSFFRIDGVDTETLCNVVRLNSFGLAYKNAPKNQVWRPRGDNDLIESGYLTLGIQIQRGLIGDELLGRAAKIADLSAPEHDLTWHEKFSADIVKLSYELARIIREIRNGQRDRFTKAEFDKFLESMTEKHISVLTANALRGLLEQRELDFLDGDLFDEILT